MKSEEWEMGNRKRGVTMVWMDGLGLTGKGGVRRVRSDGSLGGGVEPEQR